MFSTQARIIVTPKKVENAADKAAYRNFFHAAASIRKDARASIKRSKKKSQPGEPIRTRRGRGGGLAKRSVLYRADRDGAVIGFASSKIDQAMQTHEHGGVRGGVRFPARPTMAPALQRNLARFHREWRGAIG